MWIRGYLAEDLLARPAAGAWRAPPSTSARFAELDRAAADLITERGFHVLGDLSELRRRGRSRAADGRVPATRHRGRASGIGRPVWSLISWRTSARAQVMCRHGPGGITDLGCRRAPVRELSTCVPRSLPCSAACGLAAALVAPATGLAVGDAASSAGAPRRRPAPSAAAAAGDLARKPGKPNKKWKVPVGPKFNNPMVPKDRFVIERHILRAIRNTPKGEKIIISAYSLDRQVFADELIAAHKRGVKVQVLLNDHLVPSAQVRIQRVLGHKTKKSSFLKRCVSGCRADENEYNNLHSKFYLFSRTGRNRNVVMLGSQNMTLNAVRWQWNDLWTTVGKKQLYDQFEALFNDMRPDWDHRRATYSFCENGLNCPAGDHAEVLHHRLPPLHHAVDRHRHRHPQQRAVRLHRRRRRPEAHPAAPVDAHDARQPRRLHRRQAPRPLRRRAATCGSTTA